jgi:NitT/TauT family transport system substrate-binding protein
MRWYTRSRPRLLVLAALVALASLSVGPVPQRAAEAAAVPAAASAPEPALPGPQLTPVRFGSPQAISDAGVFIGRARGYFRELGLEVESLNFQSGPDTIPALASGELETAGGTISIALLNAVERGIDIKMVADKGTSRPGGFEFSQVLVRPDLLESGAVREASDLRGKRVAVASLRSGAESQVAHIAARGGVGIGEMDVVPLGYPDMLVALSNRAIDAANIIEPTMSAGIARGVVSTWEPGRSSTAFGGVYQAATVVVSGRFAAQADLARRFMVGYLRGVRVYNDAFVKGEGRADVVRLLIENTAIKDPAAYERMQMAGLDPDGRIARQSLELDMDYFRAQGYYTGPITLDNVIDMSFAEAAAQQLGPYQ